MQNHERQQMIRAMISDDIESVLQLGRDLQMFDEEGIKLIADRLQDYFANLGEDIWLTADESGLAGCLYCVPEPMTHSTWNVLMLMVNDQHQGSGIGHSLMDAIENKLTTLSASLMLVETSGLDDFESARKFYKSCGYTEQARIPDFYEQGEDKVIFTKSLPA